MSKLSSFVWGIADQLRGPYHQHEYGSVILPMTILRRLDAILEPHRGHIAQLIAGVDSEMRQASLVRQATGLRFYNASKFTLTTLLKDPDGLQANLNEYVTSFSSAIDVFERFKFDEVIAKLAEKDRLFLVVERFTKVDLHPDTISNSDMGDLFEDLIRRFAEASNATAGDHFTPRDAVRLVVDLMFAEDNDALLEKGAVRTVYDPTAGTGGMLSLAEEHLSAQNPDARLTLYGQEINDQSYAICKSDLLAKGQNPDNIKLGDTLSDDKFPGQTFDYCMANPPYGVDWKASEKAVRNEYDTGFTGRFGPGLPGVSDGQMLFLLHLASKMRPVSQGGGRVGVVMNGSPLFHGGAESGQSEIRRWLLEHDLVEAIVALPTDMFYNTGISTYVWVLDNTKSEERAGKVQLVDGSKRFSKMRKALGSKSVEISDVDRKAILDDYATFETSETSKIFDTEDFGYWTVTVERPLRLNFTCTPDRIDAARENAKLNGTDRHRLADVLGTFGEDIYRNRDAFMKDLGKHLGLNGIALTAAQRRSLWLALGERDETADEIRDGKGIVEPDPKLRDTENIPFGWNHTPKTAEADGTARGVIDTYRDAEVLPHVPDAWLDHAKTKVGYEIPFTQHFYSYVPPRPLAEIDADLNKVVAEIRDLTLSERRPAVAVDVVTQGLHLAQELIDSGHAWLGRIPSHWRVVPLWSMYRRIKDVGHPDEPMVSVFREHGVVLKESFENINQTAENRDIYQLVHPGWLLTNRMKAWQGSVGISTVRGITSGHYLCFAPLHQESHDYLNLLFRSRRYTAGYRLLSRGVRPGQIEIDNDNYRVMPVVLPPLDEQLKIVEHVRDQTAQINVLVAKSEIHIALAIERRSALITAAVTGQIDLRPSGRAGEGGSS